MLEEYLKQRIKKDPPGISPCTCRSPRWLVPIPVPGSVWRRIPSSYQLPRNHQPCPGCRDRLQGPSEDKSRGQQMYMYTYIVKGASLSIKVPSYTFECTYIELHLI